MRRAATATEEATEQGQGSGRFARAMRRSGRGADAPTDELTGCRERASLEAEYPSMVRRASRDRSHVALLDVDIDAFKRVNDEFGRARGDSVLVAFADRVRQTVRASDQVYRWGGEKFVVAAYGADADGARIAAERVRDAIEASPIGGVRLTASIGVALGRDLGDGSTDLFRSADAALREAKSLGRGQIVVADVIPDHAEVKATRTTGRFRRAQRAAAE
jgi:diguanylate cyclase (GGDEF)-like protein